MNLRSLLTEEGYNPNLIQRRALVTVVRATPR
jgi:hypothetical protein